MIQIAIDGPAGSGKSTTAKEISKILNINYMDTGAMYRAMAYAMLTRGVDLSQQRDLLSEMKDISLRAVSYTHLDVYKRQLLFPTSLRIR